MYGTDSRSGPDSINTQAFTTDSERPVINTRRRNFVIFFDCLAAEKNTNYILMLSCALRRSAAVRISVFLFRVPQSRVCRVKPHPAASWERHREGGRWREWGWVRNPPLLLLHMLLGSEQSHHSAGIRKGERGIDWTCVPLVSKWTGWMLTCMQIESCSDVNRLKMVTLQCQSVESQRSESRAGSNTGASAGLSVGGCFPAKIASHIIKLNQWKQDCPVNNKLKVVHVTIESSEHVIRALCMELLF